MTETMTLYERLELPPNAPFEEVRSAYLKAVRKHPPEKDPEGFRQVHEAFQVLRDPKSRTEYDASLGADPETRKLVDAARERIEKGDASAVPLLKRVLARFPESTVFRDLLVQALLIEEEYDDAEVQARRVLRQEPRNAAYLMRLGAVLRAADKDEEALGYFLEAMKCDPDDASAFTAAGYTLCYLERHDEAISLLRHAIQQDGKVDFDDFIYYQCLVRVLVNAERLDELTTLRREIRSILPPDPEARSFVAWFYFVDAISLAKIGRFDYAVELIEEAAAIDATLPELSAALRSIKGSKAAVDDLMRLKDDETVFVPLRFAVLALGFTRLIGGQEGSEDVFTQAAEAIAKEARLYGNELAKQIESLKTHFPAISLRVADFLTSVVNMEATCRKTMLRLKCPQCGTLGVADLPGSDVGVALAGLPYSPSMGIDTQWVLNEQARYTCRACKTVFNGNSRRVAGALGNLAQAFGSGSASRGGPCFVVTAAFGNESAYPVIALRSWRDEVLAEYSWGRLLIAAYGNIGPRLARTLEACPVGVRGAVCAALEWLARRVDPRRPLE